jgi:hypothetical protein
LVATLFVSVLPASASSWTTPLKVAGSAETGALPAPPAPASASATCLAGGQRKIVVSWSTVVHAMTYSIYTSTNAAGTFALTTNGVTTTTWTSGSLGTGNDYFKVAAYFGTKWLGAESAATGETTITGSGCTQP